MVFFYQIVTKPLTSRALPEEVCPVCEKKGGIEIVLYMRYIRALIPIYGMGRTTGVYCRHCSHELKSPGASVFAKKKYSASIGEAIKDLRVTHKRTLWQLLYPWSFWFVMPVLFGILVLIGLFEKRGREHNVGITRELLAHPQPGDVYKASWHENDGHTRASESALVKVVRISGDTLVVLRSKTTMPGNDCFNKASWDQLPRTPDGFDATERKMKLKNFLEASDFFEYSDGKDHTGSQYLGDVLGHGDMDLKFDVVERNTK